MRLSEREVHGATPLAGKQNHPLIVCEGDNEITIREGWSDTFKLTAPAARFLARKLNRLALRIEKRAIAAKGDLDAIATEARRAEAPQSDSVHEGAGPKDIAHD